MITNTLKYLFIKPAMIYILLVLGHTVNGQEVDSPSEIAVETAVEKIGDYAQYGPVIASLTMIIVKNDKDGFWQFTKSMGGNLAATWTLKYAIDKRRPEGRLDGHAFPSGHTSFAFQGASFLHRRYGWKYGIPAYIVASFVAYSRLEGINTRHDGWDVLGGIITGIGSTYLFTTPYARDHFKLNFESTNGSYQFGVTYNF